MAYAAAAANPGVPPSAPCPDCGGLGLQLVYLVFDEVTRMGTALMWCDPCNVGISMCRVQAPQGAEVMLFDADTAPRIPDYQMVEPSL